MLPEQGSALAAADCAGGEVQTGSVQHEVRAAASCANCGAAVPGRYCGECGQRVEHAVHSVWHFTQEATEDLTHADSRLWRTLAALMFKPGFLTREFLAGRRARYLPPLRLYLVLSVLFFLVAGASHEAYLIHIRTDDKGAKSMRVAPVEPGTLATRSGETPQQREARVCEIHYDGPAKRFLLPFMRKGCHNFIVDQGRSMSAAFLHNLPRAMFLFLPGLALMMMAMYWRPRRYYVEHLLFFVHNHAFAFLLFGLLGLVAEFAPAPVSDSLTGVAQLYVVYYLFVSMRRVYGQSGLRTLAKFVVLSFAYLFGAATLIALTSVYSVLTL